MPELRYLNLETTDAAFNLAAEQYVFDCLPRDRMYFMLWQNRSAVIIGKYQNTLAEINRPFPAFCAGPRHSGRAAALGWRCGLP